LETAERFLRYDRRATDYNPLPFLSENAMAVKRPKFACRLLSILWCALYAHAATAEPASPLHPTYATLLGGLQYEAITAIAFDRAGAVYVTGLTSSPDFPAVGAQHRGSVSPLAEQVFVVKLDPVNSRILYSIVIGGTERGGVIVLGLHNVLGGNTPLHCLLWHLRCMAHEGRRHSLPSATLTWDVRGTTCKRSSTVVYIRGADQGSRGW